MKKIITVLVLVSLFVSLLMPINKVSAHTSPVDGSLCNNSYYILNDFMAPVSHRSTTHYVKNGLCYKNYFIYNHKKYCNQCGYYYGFGETYECTLNHSICEISEKDCDNVKP